MRRVRRSSFLLLLAAGLLVLLAAPLVGARPDALAQTPTDQERISALETSVAVLQTQVAANGVMPTTASENVPSTPVSSATAANPSVPAAKPSVGMPADVIALVPKGTAGALSVVATGPLLTDSYGSSIAVLVRNNTSDPLVNIAVSAAAKDGSGKLIGSGKVDLFMVPYRVEPGGVAIGTVSFGQAKIPKSTKLSFKVQGAPVDASSFVGFVDLAIDSASLVDGNIVGEIANTSDQSLTDAQITVACFAHGKFASIATGNGDQDKLTPNDTSTFQITLDQGHSCDKFLVAAFGLAG